MNRFGWASNWVGPKIDWDIWIERMSIPVPMSRNVVLDYRNRGYRRIIKTGGISPESPIANGRVLVWSGEVPPVGFDWVEEVF